MLLENLRQKISANYFAEENAAAENLLAHARLTPAQHAASQSLAHTLVTAMRAQAPRGGVDALLQQYALSTEEGVVLMCLANPCCVCPMPPPPTG